MSSVISSTIGLLVIYPYYKLAVLFFGVMLFRQLKKGRDGNSNGLPLPPGPKGYPLIGNLFDMPADKPWVVYDEWRKTYGDMIYLNVLGQHFVILNSLEVITDLFEKRSSNYSDRKLTTMIELMGWSISMAMMPYGLEWRKHRKSFHEYFHRDAVTKYQPIQRQEVRAFLRRLLVTPDNFFHHIRHIFAATIMKIGYGIAVQESDDPYISIAEEALNGVAEAGIPGAFLVDLFPILKHVPSWFPGAGFQKKAARWREATHIMADKPFRQVQEQLKNGKAMPSVAASLIERLPDEGPQQFKDELERIAKNVVFIAYAAGADTTVSSVQTLFLAMALYPDVQKNAQAEIDAVVGPNRFPDFHDRPSLPYINAVVKELSRWNLVVPLGLPHVSIMDDEYNGFYIPKGTIMMGNAWSILHDRKVFNNPEEFQPERYLKDGKLNPDMRDPDCAAFGYGRRICPGRHFSDNSLYSIVSCLLAVYDIKPPLDDQGNTLKLKPEFTSGFFTYPVPFKCIIKLRTPAAEALIRDSVNEEG